MEMVTEHDFLRCMTAHMGLDETLGVISRAGYGMYIKNEKKNRRLKSIIHYKVEKNVRNLEALDALEEVVSTCYSLSIYAHAKLYYSGIKSFLLLGVSLRDGKMIAHAWVRSEFGIIMPGAFSENDFSIIRSISLEEIVKDDLHRMCTEKQ